MVLIRHQTTWLQYYDEGQLTAVMKAINSFYVRNNAKCWYHLQWCRIGSSFELDRTNVKSISLVLWFFSRSATLIFVFVSIRFGNCLLAFHSDVINYQITINIGELFINLLVLVNRITAIKFPLTNEILVAVVQLLR